MLKELNKYENLGTPKYFHELFRQISRSSEPWDAENVKQYFYNRIVEEKAVFDGCLPLAEKIGAITFENQGRISINSTLLSALITEKYLANKLVELILIAAKKDDVFYEIFCSENISYDIIYKLIQIENAAFPFRYANFRQLLISFGFLYPHPDKNIRKLVVNSKYRKIFDRELMFEIKRRKIGISELEKMLEQKQIYGKEAESFVLEYEKKRLSKHAKINNIEIISDYDVAAGYDIVSYQNEKSQEHDRFIEVKSFSGVPSFHWSNNEIKVSRIKKTEYYLYLVNRDQMNSDDYAPYVIENPHKEIMENSQESTWEKQVEGYFVTEKGI